MHITHCDLDRRGPILEDVVKWCIEDAVRALCDLEGAIAEDDGVAKDEDALREAIQ